MAPLDLLITVPHGAPGNDDAAPPVARALVKQLRQEGVNAHVMIARTDRYVERRNDQNRPHARGSAFRRAVERVIRTQRPRFLLDVHSFPAAIERFAGQDIVLLETVGVTDPVAQRAYSRLLGTACDEQALGPLAIRVDPAQYCDDILVHARQLGMPASAVALAEHSTGGDPVRYARAHAWALKTLLRYGTLPESARLSDTAAYNEIAAVAGEGSVVGRGGQRGNPAGLDLIKIKLSDGTMWWYDIDRARGSIQVYASADEARSLGGWKAVSA